MWPQRALVLGWGLAQPPGRWVLVPRRQAQVWALAQGVWAAPVQPRRGGRRWEPLQRVLHVRHAVQRGLLLEQELWRALAQEPQVSPLGLGPARVCCWWRGRSQVRWPVLGWALAPGLAAQRGRIQMRGWVQAQPLRRAFRPNRTWSASGSWPRPWGRMGWQGQGRRRVAPRRLREEGGIFF